MPCHCLRAQPQDPVANLVLRIGQLPDRLLLLLIWLRLRHQVTSPSSIPPRKTEYDHPPRALSNSAAPSVENAIDSRVTSLVRILVACLNQTLVVSFSIG